MHTLFGHMTHNQKAAKKLQQTSDTWYNNIKARRFPKHDAWLLVHTTIVKSLQLPLHAMTLTKRECQHIMAPVCSAGLPAQGVNRKLPDAVLFGPVSM